MAKAPPSPITVLEQQYTLAEVSRFIRLGETELREQVKLYIKTAGAEGIGPVARLNSKVVVLSASAVNHYLARHRLDTLAW